MIKECAANDVAVHFLVFQESYIDTFHFVQ